ncbi:putative alcohol dehydrogenase [Dendryphion nanum]|uniref:Alcohol dehydrogenase n=1 Tax=Dendryphion nanum TaxID=256645 RepID=A0A9P9EFW0_9PLEO|nr:putative alcohol dehydrogenase [Dendryphion nanum]
MANKALVIPSKGAPLELQIRGIPTPGSDQVVIRNHAVAINFIDNLQRNFGFKVPFYPIVIGADVSGVVQTVGGDVKNIKPGDRVAGYALAGQGAFQEYTLLTNGGIVTLASRTTFAEGAVLPMAIATSGVAIFLRMGIPWGPRLSPQNGIFFVHGASSSVGSAAVQLAKILGFEVFATAGDKNREYVKKLGANEVWDHQDSALVEKIMNAAAGRVIKYGFAAVSMGGASQVVARVLSAANAGGEYKARLCVTTPWDEKEAVPQDIELTQTLASAAVTENNEFGVWLFNEFLKEKIESGEYVPSPEIEIIEGGLEKGVVSALDRYGNGVSATKIVVPLIK